MQKRITAGLMAGVLFVLAGLSGCGLSPQQARPEPRLSSVLAPVAQGQAVSVRVTDARTSNVLGNRGGLYENSNPVTAEGRAFLPRLQAEVEAGLRMRGFVIQPAGQAAAEFDLQVTELTYQLVDGRTVMGEVELTATYLLHLRKSGRTQKSTHTANLAKKFAKAPSDAANNQLLSTVMSDALDRLFQEPTISEFLMR